WPAVGGGFGCNGGEHESRIAPILRDGYELLALGLHLDGVVEGADAHLSTAADERLQGAGAALHIGDLDREARVLEVAEALGDRERQIEDCRFAADRRPTAARSAVRVCPVRRQGSAARLRQPR